ncbi:MAG: DUF1684 domain-containing protein [Balneolaceae bacterium]|jgi:uncharacterized protein (DUF1684 family)
MNYHFNALFISIILFVLVSLLTACGKKDPKMDHNKYLAEVNGWHQKRIESLKQEDSWLSLAGLYEVKQGTHTFGSDSTNDIIFPPKAAAKMGIISRRDSIFKITVAPGVHITNEGQTASEITMKTSEQVEEPTVLRYHSLFWYVIKRREHYYIRLKDAKNPNFTSFHGIDRFPVSLKWRVKATFNRFEEPKTISIPDVMGEVFQDSLYGTLNFTIDGKQYSLAPLGSPDKDDEFFIIVGDKTNGDSTYGGGRFIYSPTPDQNGITYIDFNKAYNPPCVFTDFATCPLPPSQNRLPIKITAGEKMYHASNE